MSASHSNLNITNDSSAELIGIMNTTADFQSKVLGLITSHLGIATNPKESQENKKRALAAIVSNESKFISIEQEIKTSLIHRINAFRKTTAGSKKADKNTPEINILRRVIVNNYDTALIV